MSKSERGNGLPTASLCQVWGVWRRLAKRILGGTFERYQKGADGFEGIPRLPVWPMAHRRVFDQVVLVDERLVRKAGLSEVCRLSGIDFSREDDFYEPHDEARSMTGVYWMRAQLTRKKLHGSSAKQARDACLLHEIALSVPEGIFAFNNDPRILMGQGLDLAGSVRRGMDTQFALMGLRATSPTPSARDGVPILGYTWDAEPNASRCFASRLVYK